MAAPKKIITYSILVKGRVQGIGFRPFVYRQAKKFRLTGIVRNTKQGVLIRVQGKNSKKMVEVLKKSPPLLSNITGITIKKLSYKRYVGFSIKKSTNLNQASDLVQIMPDLSVCPECVKDFTDQQNRRYYYPFTNCTQCGPRYSIIRSLPYDRSKTTMKDFTMCKKCAQEYNNPSNRRFHAQPNACNVCGPWLTLFDSNSKTIISNDSIKVLNKTKQLIAHNKIIAIRSIGGFLLACDAKSNMAVNRLRSRKNRPAKPFAIMCKDIQTIQKLCFVNKREIQILKSKIAPIVLLKKKKTNYISEKIAPKNDFLGVMLPYTPLHKLLFSCLPRNANVSRETYLDALVMTSANPKGAPILANANDVVKKLGGVVDYILDHNRPIESRCDDSVVFNYMGPVIIRYSRGYVPSPIQLRNLSLRPVLAFGSDLKSHFALGQADKVFLSPYIGDLISEQSVSFFFEILGKYQRWFGIKPSVVCCDLHPNYISRRLAEQYAYKHHLQLMKIQHHYAHLVGVMAEFGIRSKVIGVGYDGTGYGTDENIWGSEIMILDYQGFERTAHLKYLPLVGGDAAITNPELIAKTYLQQIQNSKFEIQNSIMTSSMGRLFDAVSSILGLVKHQSFEGEAPIALEAEAMKSIPKFQNTKTPRFRSSNLLDPHAILSEVLYLKKQGVSKSEIALYFHNRIISDTFNIVIQIGRMRNINTVCLSGGVFQNRIILDGICSELTHAGFKVFFNRTVPINDGGVSFGQAVIAGQMRSQNLSL